tara:strand:- start:289 stop:963 length:675 start_codon:yes stop_codon:yes gene_type:complete
MAAIHFDPTTHEYITDEGRIVPSVTQRIKRAGLLGPAAQFYSAASADRGTAIHLACEHRDQGRDVTAFLRGEFGGFLTSYIKWCDVMEPVWTSIETPQYSPRYQTAGTADRVGTINGRPVVLDLKSGGKANWHGVQLSLYSMIQQDSDIPPQERRRLVLYLRSNGRMAQSVEFSSPYDYTQALALIANQTQETPDDSDHHDTRPTRDHDDDGPPAETGPRKADT